MVQSTIASPFIPVWYWWYWAYLIHSCDPVCLFGYNTHVTMEEMKLQETGRKVWDNLQEIVDTKCMLSNIAIL